MSNNSCNVTPYTTKRYWMYGIMSLISLIIPFITIDGKHIFLLSFDKMKLELMGIAFDMQEFYLIPFLLIIMFITIFFVTALGGRVWCGWSCPQTIFRVIYRDFIEGTLLGMRKRRNKQKESGHNQGKKVIGILLWSVLSFLAAANFMWYFVPPEDFFSYIQNPSDHKVLLGFWSILALFLIYDVIWLKEDFCFYVCPYVRIQSVMYDNDSVMPVYDEKRGGQIFSSNGDKIADKPEAGECIGCMACVTVCPTHIDIRKGLQMECINCLECVDACTPIMGKLGKPSLISWTSYPAMQQGVPVQWFRGRIIAYMIALIITTIALFIMGSKKEHMLLNINKTSELYNISENKTVKNSYTFLFANTDDKEHQIYFEIVGRNDITIERPSKPLKMKSGEKIKEIVVLKTTSELVKDDRKDTPIAIKIRAFAIDNPKEIFVERDTVFFYPSQQVLLKH